MSKNIFQTINHLNKMSVKTKEFGAKEYWDEEYQKKNTTFEWLEVYDTLKPFIERHIKRNQKILMPGCGNSTLGPDMYQDGYKTIHNSDFSEVVIDQMKERFSHLDQMEWFVDDMRKMNLPDNSYDTILDKGGLDALYTIDNDGIAAEEALFEYARVLKPGGKAFIISFGQPVDRECNFDRPNKTWKYDGFEMLPREIAPNTYRHIYVLTKPS